MKLVKTLTFLLIIASAYSSADWAGIWNTMTSPSGKCVPANPIVLSQNSTDVTATWTWQNSVPCQEKGVARSQVSGAVPLPSGTSATLNFNYDGYVVQGELTLNGNQATFVGTDGTTVVFERENSDDSDYNWAGSWYSNDQDPSDCAPANPLVISQTATTVTSIWTWSQSEECIGYGINGTAYSQSAAIPSGNVASVHITVDGYTLDGSLTLNGNQLTFQGGPTTVVFTRSGPNYALPLSLSLISLCLSAIYLLI